MGTQHSHTRTRKIIPLPFQRSALHSRQVFTMCITKECADPTQPGVWWREDDKWVRYNAKHSEAILSAYRQLNASANPQQTTIVPLGPIASSIHPSGHSYTVVLPQLKQKNDGSGYSRDVKIVHAPVSASKNPSAKASSASEHILGKSK